jgi:hypothetical protein
LLILRAAFIMKYGINPWILFMEVKLSEASSEATKWWNMVDASLTDGAVGQRPGDTVIREWGIRHPRPLDQSLVIGW